MKPHHLYRQGRWEKSPPPVGDCRHLLLKATGLTYRQWALRRNYGPRTVTQAVSRWAGKKELPRGRLTYRILRDLSRDIKKELVPGVLSGDGA